MLKLMEVVRWNITPFLSYRESRAKETPGWKEVGLPPNAVYGYLQANITRNI